MMHLSNFHNKKKAEQLCAARFHLVAGFDHLILILTLSNTLNLETTHISILAACWPL